MPLKRGFTLDGLAIVGATAREKLASLKVGKLEARLCTLAAVQRGYFPASGLDG